MGFFLLLFLYLKALKITQQHVSIVIGNNQKFLAQWQRHKIMKINLSAAFGNR